METQILNIIKSIRESFGASISVYTLGNCYQFYEILKSIYPNAEAYYDGNHVWTKINGRFYDIRGLKDLSNINIIKVENNDLIERLIINKYTDERRKTTIGIMNENSKKKINTKNMKIDGKKEILAYWVKHTDEKRHYLKWDWSMIWVLVKYRLMWGMEISFTCTKACDREEYLIQFFAE